MNDQVFQSLIETISAKQDELKEIKSLMKDIEEDVPMELEDLLMSLRDMKKQVKERRDEHLKNLLENNAEYPEYRERIQLIKEEIATAKLELFAEAAKASHERGGLDKTITVHGAPYRLQTESEVSVYLNGKVVK